MTITVTANGSPLPTCKWYHGEQLLQSKPNRIIITNDGATHVLKLLDVEMIDAGIYKVIDKHYSKN